MAADAGLDLLIDSAGTGAWHVGNPPDPRAQETALKAGFDISNLRARQIDAADYARFTHILAMDHDNLATIRSGAPENNTTARVSLLLDHVPGREGAAVSDPYYGGEEHFEDTLADIMAAAKSLIDKLQV